jgi:hypothetical protein
MRTRSTNFLQSVVLISGLTYLFLGILFFVSPFYFAKMVGVQTSDEWLSQIKIDEFLILIYVMARALSALLIVVGLSMVMPVFDPLKYRLMIYLFGVIFPLISASFMTYFGYTYDYITPKIIGGALLIIFVTHMFALLLTKDNARKGIE